MRFKTQKLRNTHQILTLLDVKRPQSILQPLAKGGSSDTFQAAISGKDAIRKMVESAAIRIEVSAGLL